MHEMPFYLSPDLDNEVRLFPFLASRMSAERSRRGKFAKLVPYHIFGDEDFYVSATVMNHECVSNKLGDHGAGSGPGFDRLFFAGIVKFDDFGKQLFVYKRTFFL